MDHHNEYHHDENFEILHNYQNVTQMQNEQVGKWCQWTCLVSIMLPQTFNLQKQNKEQPTIFAKCNKVKHKKTRYACLFLSLFLCQFLSLESDLLLNIGSHECGV